MHGRTFRHLPLRLRVQVGVREWSVDIPGEFAGLLLDKWHKRHKATANVNALHNFIHERCPQWGKWLQDQKL